MRLLDSTLYSFSRMHVRVNERLPLVVRFDTWTRDVQWNISIPKLSEFCEKWLQHTSLRAVEQEENAAADVEP